MGVIGLGGDLIDAYVGIELHSLALYILAASSADDAKSSDGG